MVAISRVCAGLVLAGWLGVILGLWEEDPYMQPITRLLFLLASPMLTLMTFGTPKVERYKLALSMVSLFSSCWAAIHQILGGGFAFFGSLPSSYAQHPGDPSWGTTVGLIALSASGMIYHDSWGRYWAGGLAIGLGVCGILGHLLGIPALFFYLPPSPGMALSTAILLVLGGAVPVQMTLHWRKRAGQARLDVVC